MASLSPKFIVLNLESSSKGEEGLIYCSSNNAHTHWPKPFRRGRPRKESIKHEHLLKPSCKGADRSSRDHYEFVSYSDGQQPDGPDTRKLVRAHVMRNHRRQQRLAPHSEQGIHDTETQSRGDCADTTGYERRFIWWPARWGRDPFKSFPIEMQPYMFDLIDLYTSAVADHAYRIEACWGLNPMLTLWMPLALTDPALLHSILYCSEQFRVRANGQKEGPSAINHLFQTIRILNVRLQNPLQGTSDSTIAAVALLALTEQSSENRASWRTHMGGIQRMIEMRRGMTSFERSPILHDTLCR